MGLFKSKDERRIEREMKIRGGMRSIERSIRQQEKFADDFIKNAQHARKIGDEGQYQFIRSALKKTAAVKKMLERQLLSINNAMLIQQQAQASQQFAESMTLMAREIGRVFGELDLTKTQAHWERAVSQAGSIEERMDIFLDSMEQSATTGAGHRLPRGIGHRRGNRPHDLHRRPRLRKSRTRQTRSTGIAKSPRNWGRRSRRINSPKPQDGNPAVRPPPPPPFLCSRSPPG